MIDKRFVVARATSQDPARRPAAIADFLYGPRSALGEDSYVLCEINARSCFAIPDQAAAAVARLTAGRLRDGRGN
jgi:hypothetical protein